VIDRRAYASVAGSTVHSIAALYGTGHILAADDSANDLLR
jgi:hypothetical protein